MPFEEYVKDAQILEVIDERKLSQLAKKFQAKSWDKKVLQRAKVSAAAIFESYAANKYTLAQLRTDPPPEFAVEHNLNIILYKLYKNNKRHVVPRAISNDYKRTMKILEGWGTPKIIGDGAVTEASGLVDYIPTETEFNYEQQKHMW